MTVSLSELDPNAADIVRGAAPSGFPDKPNTTAVVDGRLIMWLGPDEWLVLGGSESDFPGLSAVVDVSANRFTFELAGPSATKVLGQGCSLDLDIAVFPPGRCAQTLLADIQVIVHRPETEVFRIFGRPSFKPFLRAWLEDAMGTAT